MEQKQKEQRSIETAQKKEQGKSQLPFQLQALAQVFNSFNLSAK